MDESYLQLDTLAVLSILQEYIDSTIIGENLMKLGYIKYSSYSNNVSVNVKFEAHGS